MYEEGKSEMMIGSTIRSKFLEMVGYDTGRLPLRQDVSRSLLNFARTLHSNCPQDVRI